jgi:hypothetical protein
MTRKLAFPGLLLGLGLILSLGCNGGGSSSATPASYAETAVTGGMISSAMEKATSWHMTMKSGKADMSMDISCPDKMRMQTKTGAMTVETVRVGNAMYTKMGSKWMKVPSSVQQQPVCGAGASSRVATMDPTLKMTKKGTESINGESCTVWEGTSKDDKGATHTFNMCVGSDNLPRRVTSGDAVMTYTNWNKPVSIEAPKV